MAAIMDLALFLVVVWALAYWRISLVLSTIVIATLIILLTKLEQLSGFRLFFYWGLFVALAIPLNVPYLRRKFISNRILAEFRSSMPSMSKTEREALEAGTVWWEGELFSGRPIWKKFFAYPTPTLTDEERAFLDGPVQELCKMLNDWQITEELHDLPPHVWQFIKDNRFFGMIIPKRYGGLEMSAYAHSSVVMKIASRSVTAAVTVMVPNSLGPAELLLHYGTEEQKNYYLPRLAAGDEVPCFALTGPEAGSDASSITDKGVVCKGQVDGQETLGIRLNWDKRYITLGPVATVLGLAFKLHDPDHLLGDQEDLGITCALIPTNTPGINIGRRHAPLNIAFQNGPNWGKDVFIPMDFVIGGLSQVGHGWRMLMESLAAGRSISLPALSTGAGKLVCRATGAYAHIRKQFKTPIGRFEGVQEALARMAGYSYMMDAARIHTAGAVDLGEKPSVASAIVKYHLTESMRKVVNDAMDVQGGSGICMGPRNLIGRMYQAIPISITVEGANILTRNLIIFGQGAIRCHPYVQKEMLAAADFDKERGAKTFDYALLGHMGFLVRNAARSLFIGLTGARLVMVPLSSSARHYCQQIGRMSSAFALVADVAMMILGGSLKRREMLSARLGDILSQLYLASTVIKHFQSQGTPEADIPLMKWACEDALFKIQTSFEEFFENFPNGMVSSMLRHWIFPLGRSYRPPSDSLTQQVAELLLGPSIARDRLTAGIYLTKNDSEQMGRIDSALEIIVAAEEIESRVKAAIRGGLMRSAQGSVALAAAVKEGIIREEDVRLIEAANEARRNVIKVDDFAPDYWRRSDSDVEYNAYP